MRDVHGRDRLVRDCAAGLRGIDGQLATKISQIMVPSAEVANKSPFADVAITGGVLADEAMKLFR